MIVDAAAGGCLTSKTPDESYQLIDDMAQNHQQWTVERTAPKQGGRLEVDAITALSAKLDAMTKKIEGLSTNAVNTNNVDAPCEICGVSGHGPLECQQGMSLSNGETIEHANVLGNYNRPRNDPYSNTYNPGWRNHPNFSYRNQNVENSNANQAPPGFNGRTFNSQSNPQNQPQKSNLESLMENFVSTQIKQNDLFQNQVRELTSKVDQLAAQNRILETQIAQQTSSSIRPPGTLSGKPELNPREHCNLVVIRNEPVNSDFGSESDE